MADYRKQATQEYDVSYNQKVQSLKNQLAQNQQTLDQQKTGINANYDTQVANQNLSNQKSKNNISNTMLGRGLANSSIVTSGLAEADQINNRYVGEINSGRTGALNDIEAQKALLAQNLQGSLATMSADREDAISTLARQLEDRQFEKDYKNNGLALQREQMLAQQQYQNMSLAQQKELANAQLAWSREQAQMENAYKYATLDWQKQQANKTDNNAYNAYLSAYSNISGDSTKTQYEKKLALATLANEMEMYSGKNGVDLSDLIKKASKNSLSANGVNRVNGTGISRSTK